ncbi:P-loop NTPase fold protein [Bacillus paranthracis]|uniref:P-loop NTPase fold protein n=1 Tax=Bacillus cereus group TaxID=86661 RepID=UPI00065C08B8|nr:MULTISPECIES: P-loop NTPase fold protein [Bacillus cereus group]KMP15171.1 hypothetical protein TU49_24845 [Bacillus cereus]MBL3845397.1 hypothetical protein [Bacillus cereus]MDA1889609.1 P-loop NTPase fold protein [Bacillus cereus group sp. BY11-1LC]MDA2589956.1 P-loop NTPase fold protein [Bacillus cereus group sp. Bc065]MDK7439699.1 P-loop NTPase fold protein [Bacillus paranthracis]
MSTSTSESVQTSLSESEKYTVNSILNYIESDKTGYAILLNGKWGSGKTYFWKNILKKEIKDRGKDVIYVSLYGVSSIEEIDKKIVLGKLEFVEKISDSKIGGGITEIGKAVFGVVKKFDITGLSDELSDINFKDFFNYSDTVLCFDDLERVNMSVDEVLGYINNFVEHDGIKVIIIGNEDEIADKLNEKNRELKMLTTYFYLKNTEDGNHTTSKIQGEKILENDLIKNKLNDLFHKQNEYKRIKEKLIGKTLTIQLDEENLIGNIINQTSNTKLHSFLEHNIEIIDTTFKESGNRNIRILKQALEDFELIYEQCEQNAYELNEMPQSILKFVLAASFEIKNDEPGNEELKEINSNDDFKEQIGITRIEKKSDKVFPEKFVNKYYGAQVSSYHKRYFFKFAEILIRDGILDLELFKKELNNFQLELKNNNYKPEDLFFTNYWDLMDEEFIRYEELMYDKLINGEARIDLYLKAYKTYRYFVEKKMVQKDIVKIKKDLMSGLKKVGEKGKSIENFHTFFLSKGNEDDSDLLEFIDMIIRVNNQLKLDKEKEDIQLLLVEMQTNFHKFFTVISRQYISKPFFVHCNLNELYNNVINLLPTNINSIEGFVKKRIVTMEDSPLIQEDIQMISSLGKMLLNEIDVERMTPRRLAIQELVESIQEYERKALEIQNSDTSNTEG